MTFTHKKGLEKKFNLAAESFRVTMNGISAISFDYDPDHHFTDSLNKLLVDWIHLEYVIDALSDLVPNQEIELKYGKVENSLSENINWQLEVFCTDKRFLKANFIYRELLPEEFVPFESRWKIDSYFEVG